jgi:hypothetical protein
MPRPDEGSGSSTRVYDLTYTYTHFVLNRRIYDKQEDEVISERMIEKDREKRNFIKAP